MKVNTNYPEIVQQIHSEVFEACDQILAEALPYANHGVSPKQVQKLKDMEALGFTQTKEYKQLHAKVSEAERIQEYVQYIEQYKMCYPQNRFITHERLIAICQKYGLVKASVNRYTGFIPEHCVAEIKNFVVRQEHIDHLGIVRNFIGGDRLVQKSQLKRRKLFITEVTSENIKPLFSICAPIQDINTSGMVLAENGVDLEFKDPIVLCPVKYGYIVVTAWGDEAKDPEIRSESRN